MRLALSAIAASLWMTHTGFAAHIVTVDPTRQYQIFEGWGTSLAWMGKVIGNFPSPARDEYVDLIFDRDKGLGLNVVRYNIGGGENPSRHGMSYRVNMDGFEPSPGKWDWEADAGQRWVLRQAMVRGANIVEAFSNSPPYWMTSSGSVTGAKDGSNNLSVPYWSEFPRYLAAVTQHFHDAWGITFRTVEPFNEPVSGWWKDGTGQEGCHFFHGSNETSIIRSLAQDLAQANLPTTVSAADENSIDEAVDGMEQYDPATIASISQINTHSYHGGKRAALYQAALSKHKRLWMSEYGDGDASGIALAMQINRDMNGLHPSAWSYWQIVDSAGGWAMLRNPEDGRRTTYTINEKYWVYANFTKFIRPGSVIIGTDDPKYSLAAMDAAGGTLTLVTTNQGDAVRTVTYDLSKFPLFHAVIKAYQTSGRQKLEPVPGGELHGNLLTFVVPGASVTTVVLSGVK